MTMPSERARALRWAGEILRDIQAGNINNLDELKRQAKVILRHYPSALEIENQAKSDSHAGMLSWLAPDEV